jgi:hypothetical protein
MSTFASAPALSSVTPLDPTKHVKFTRGMVLGVTDFVQEFAYLSARDRWIVRDLIGYGVVSGLRLEVDPPPAGSEEKGPRVAVSPGVAVLPSGRLVCVTPAQCAFLGDWVASKRVEIEEEAAGSPPSTVPAYVVLCHAECETDDAPIPGEPCRSEENLMAPSRVKDSFALELRLGPPAQVEEDAVRWLVAWLSAVPVEEDGSDREIFLEELRRAGLTEDSLPDSIPEPLDFSPPGDLAIPRARVTEYLEAAFELWTRELRGRWRTRVPGCECAPGPGCPPEEDCLLLGRLDIPVIWDAVSGAALVGAPETVAIDFSRRPTLLHLRLLQEWLLAGAHASAPVRAVVRTGVSVPEVAGDGLEVFAVDDKVFHLVPAGFDPSAVYAVHGTGVAAVGSSPPAPSVTFELLDPLDADLSALLSDAGIVAPGLTVRVQAADGSGPGRGFSVRIERIGGAA